MEQESQWIVQNLRAIIADLNDECSVGTGITLDTVEGYRVTAGIMRQEITKCNNSTVIECIHFKFSTHYAYIYMYLKT